MCRQSDAACGSKSSFGVAAGTRAPCANAETTKGETNNGSTIPVASTMSGRAIF
jgi:hypothetical protein